MGFYRVNAGIKSDLPVSFPINVYVEWSAIIRFVFILISILVPRAHDPSGLWQGSRARASRAGSA